MVANGPVHRRKHTLLTRLWPFRGRASNRRVRIASPLGRPIEPSMRRPARPPRDWRKALRLVVLVATGAALAAGSWGLRRWLTTSPHFAVRAVKVSPTTHVTSDIIVAQSGIHVGDNLFRADLAAAARALQADPWVRRVVVRRELPSTIAIDVTEREPACVVALGALYLADATGEAFKRASLDDTAGLPVVTGVPRDGYVDDRDASQALIREALAALSLWRAGDRGAIGEVHVDAAAGVTLYTRAGAVGVRLGRGSDEELRARLHRYDLVARALAKDGESPAMVLVDGKTHPDRVTVRLATR